jgi:hypothetical protein
MKIFTVLRAAILILVTAAIGYFAGFAFAVLWNRIDR